MQIGLVPYQVVTTETLCQTVFRLEMHSEEWADHEVRHSYAGLTSKCCEATCYSVCADMAMAIIRHAETSHMQGKIGYSAQT